MYMYLVANGLTSMLFESISLQYSNNLYYCMLNKINIVLHVISYQRTSERAHEVIKKVNPLYLALF